MDHRYQSLDAEPTGGDRAAWALLIFGGAIGGAVGGILPLINGSFGPANLVYMAVFWAAPGAGFTAIVARLFFAGPDRTITIARRYRRWKPFWAGLLLAVGLCSGAGTLLGIQGLGMYAINLIQGGDPLMRVDQSSRDRERAIPALPHGRGSFGANQP